MSRRRPSDCWCYLGSVEGLVPWRTLITSRANLFTTVDSQAYGTKARVEAREAGISKTNRFLAQIMTDWYLKQVEALQAPAGENRHPPALLDLRMPPPLSPLEARLHRARKQMRELLEAGEIDWQQLHDESVLAFAFDEDDEPDAASCPGLALAA